MSAVPPASPSGTMERILRLMSEKKASDVYLSAHSPALIRRAHVRLAKAGESTELRQARMVSTRAAALEVICLRSFFVCGVVCRDADVSWQ